jgi:hypothetical protein
MASGCGRNSVVYLWSFDGLCEKGKELPVFINGVGFVDKLSSFDPCSLVTLVKAVLLPEDD